MSDAHSTNTRVGLLAAALPATALAAFVSIPSTVSADEVFCWNDGKKSSPGACVENACGFWSGAQVCGNEGNWGKCGSC